MIAPPEDSPLTGVVHKNEGLLARTVGRGEKMRLDAEARKFRRVKRRRTVSADFADVARVKSPMLACDDRGGGLPARQHRGCANLDFRAARGIMRDANQCVSGVEPDADEVDFFHFQDACHLAGVTVNEEWKELQSAGAWRDTKRGRHGDRASV